MSVVDSHSAIAPRSGEDPRVRAAASLKRVISELRRRLIGLAVAEGALWALLVGAGILALGMLVDWWFELPRWARATFLAINAVATGWVLWRRLAQPLIRLPGTDDLAQLLERRRPELRSRVISAIQLGRIRDATPEAQAFIERLVEDAARAAATVDPRSVVDPAGARRAASVALPGLALIGGVILWALPASWILLRRAALEEIAAPRKTRLLEVSGNITSGRGDDVVLWATAEGVLPDAGRIIVQHPSGRIETLPMGADSARAGRYERVVGNAQSSFEYRVRVNDAESETYRVEVLPRPVITNLVFTLELPEYTGLPARDIPAGELALLRGSVLKARAAAGQPLREATVRLGGVEKAIPAELDSEDPARLTASIPIDDPRLSSLSLDLVDARGIPSRDPAVYAIQVVEDRAPRVRILAPARREELATAQGTVLVAFEASDDFGLAGVRLQWQPAGSTNAPATMDLDLEGGSPTETRRRFDWRLSDMRPGFAEGDLIEFWIEALDRRTDGTGVGRTEKRLLRVVSEAEKRADLLSRAGDAIGRLGDVAEGQERLNERLGRIILPRPAERSP